MSRLTKVSIDSVLYDIGNKGINSYETLSEMLAEPISNLYEGAICWVNQEETYFQWRSSNEIISNYGRYRELEFGSDFQVDDPTIDAADHKDKIIQYIGQDSPDHGFKRGYFYESRMSNVINYVIAEVNSTTTGTFYTYDGVNYTPVVLVGDGTGYVEGTVYYKEQNVEVYTWGNINTFKIEVLDDTTPLTDKTYSSDYIEKNFEAKVEYLTQEEYDNLEESVKTDGTEYRTSDTGIIYKNGVMFGKLVDEDFDETSENAIMNKTVTAKFDELREYVDNDLTTSLQQYTDDKIDDTDDEVFEDKTWSSNKINTKFEEVTQTITDGNDALTEYVDTSLEGYEKKFVECTFEEYKQMETDGTVEADVDYVIISNESGVLLSDLDTNHGDSEISTYEVIETLKNDVEDITTELKTSENTDIVPITVLSDIPFLSKGDNYCYYKIVNGICYFQLFIDSTADVTTYTELCNSLPKPSLASVYFGFPTFYNINDVYKTLQVYISEDGVMSVNNSTTNASYMLNGSYPIA